MRLIHCLILIVLSFAIYLPSLSSPPFIVDDVSMISSMRAMGEGSSFHLLITNFSRYFRPVVMSSFLMDFYLWDLNPVLMRLTNVLIHTANALLIYWIACKTANKSYYKNRQLELLLAATFAIHPILTESINWISGRTDPLAALFALIGILLFLHTQQSKGITTNWLASIFVFIGCLTKEVAFFVYPAILCYLWIEKISKRQNLFSWRLQISIPYLIGIIFYLSARYIFIRGQDKGIGKITISSTEPVTQSVFNQLFEATKSLGFYAKKILIPTPQNFAIDQINEYYFWLGLIILLLSFIVIWKRDIASFFTLLLLATISPALINALYKIAWTAYAERYMYLPVALFLLTFIILIRNINFSQNLASLILICLMLYYLPTTLQRNILWSNQLDLLEETVSLSPYNTKLRTNYAVALAAFGHINEARKQIDIVDSQAPGTENIDYYLAKFSLLEGDVMRARKELDVYYVNDRFPNKLTRQLMAEIDNKLSSENVEKETILENIIGQ